MKKWLPLCLFIAILLLAVCFRLYMLGTVPAGLTNDEANSGYDAYSLLLTGKDQWGHFLPVSFRGFGDYPAPLYRYILIPFIATLGLNAFAVRLPSALFGIAMVIGIFFLCKKLFNKPLAYIAMLFTAVSPWAIGMSRIGLESNVAASILAFSLVLFAYVKKNKIKNFILGTLLLALTIYTYASYTLLAPLIFLSFSLYLVWKKQLPLKKILLIIVLFFIFLLPLFLNRNATAASRFSQVGILHNISSIGLVNVLNDQRGACQKYLPHALCRLENNKIILFTSSLFTNYMSHFSFDFLYINGTATQNSVLYMRGLEYLFDSIFFILGLFYLFRQPFLQKGILIFLLFSVIPDSLTGPGNYSRALSMLPFLLITEAVGAYTVLDAIHNLKFNKIKIAILTILGMVFFGSVAVFAVTYFTYFRDYYSRFSQYGYQPLMQHVEALKNSYDKIYITTHVNDAKQYVYYLFYEKYDPSLYQTKQRISYHVEGDGWVSIDKINNIYFVPTLPDKKQLDQLSKSNQKVLLISHPSDFIGNFQPEFSIKDRVEYEMFEAVDMKKLLMYHAPPQPIIPGK